MRGRSFITLLAPLAALAFAGGCGETPTPTAATPGGAVFLAYPNQVTFSGQGLIADGFGGYDLLTEICGVANGADADGPYLLWVLTATGAKNAVLAW